MELDAKQIDAVAELRRHGIKYTPTGDEWVSVNCPFHADESASCGVNIVENYYKCHAAGCGSGGDIIAFLAGAMKTTRALMLQDLVSRYELNDDVTISPVVIERDHEHLWSCGPQLQELRNRAVSDAAIRKYRIGARNVKDEVRVTIPIKNSAGLFVNVRKYLPGAPGAEKMRNETRCGKIRLFPIEQLFFPTVVVCGGELKAIVAAEELNAHGIGAISTTGGEGSWKDEFTTALAGKSVFVCFDVDDAGVRGARAVCKQLPGSKLLKLPLDTVEFPHGDINDFVAGGGKLFPLLSTAEPLPEDKPREREDLPLLAISLSKVLQHPKSDQPLEFAGIINAQGPEFRVPKTLRPVCDRAQDFCGVCPVDKAANLGIETFDIEAGNPKLLRYIGENESKWPVFDKALLEIPFQCHAVEFERDAYYTLQDIEVAEPTGLGKPYRGVWFKPDSVGLVTEKYTFTGTVQAFPASGEAIIFAYKQELRDNELSEYKRPADNGKHLKIFQAEWTVDGLEKKLAQIHTDLGANALKVYFRNDMNLIADLAFHSVLQIPYDGGVKRGWVDVLIVGDSGQAKTSMLDGLLRHYGLGVKADCKNATVPGMLSTTRKGLSGQFMVSAGVIPRNDRQLVVLEEFKGMSSDVMQKLTEVRSSGTLSVAKAGHGKFDARVRLIVMSNPKSARCVGEYTFGTEILKELIENPEDIRRFDAAIILSKDDINPGLLSGRRRNPVDVPHNFTAALCRELIVWAWTRTPEQIIIPRDSFGLILDIASDLQSEFSDTFPLVDSTMGEKLAKLSVALAVRTFSADDSGECVVVRPCHVEFIAAALRRIYSQPAFGYDAYTASLKRITHFLEGPVDEAVRELAVALSFVENMRHHSKISASDIGNYIGATDYSQSNAIISLLVRCGAMIRIEGTAGAGTMYAKTADFSAYLKRAAQDPTLKNVKGVHDDRF